MEIRYDDGIMLDYVDDTITMAITGMNWATISTLGTFVMRVIKPEFPVKETLTPPIIGTSFEWRAIQMTDAFVQVELEIVDVPSGVLPEDADSYTDSVFLIPYSQIRHVQFRANNSVQGNERWIE